MATSSSSTAGFSGVSNYAPDLQSVISRRIALASLPLQVMQGQLSDLTSQSSALNALDVQFSALQSTITNLSSSTQHLLSSSVSDQTVLTATSDATALPGSYTINVTDPGSFTAALSNDGLTTVTDPSTGNISSASSFTLTVGGVATTITPESNDLNSLAAAINDSSAGVQATIINVGPPSAPDYRLSLQTNTLGNVAIQLNDGTDLLSTLSPGTNATYQVNGQPTTPISSDSRTITIAPGVTVNLLTAGVSTVTVNNSTSAISGALNSFVSSFNATVDALSQSFGENGGPLSGQSVVYSLSRTLSQLGNYAGTSGNISSLADLGLGFDTSGHLTFDPAKALSNPSSAQLDDIVSFLGTPTSGGFLQFATDQLTSIEDPTAGILKSAISSTSDSITHENQLISNEQDFITQLQTNLQTQMAAADALIAQLEQQTSYFTSLFQSMELQNAGSLLSNK